MPRRKMIEDGAGLDWSMAEHLAFGTLLADGFAVRLSGQDVQRGTFSQRHAVLVDQETEKRYTPLNHLVKDQKVKLEVINSMLSEEAVLGFEYGYSLAEPNTLVLWEAQFGDFANGAQVVFDQFISSGERKWLRMSGLVCLLPHGYEGQGPEHSSARLERYPADVRRRQHAGGQLHHAGQLLPHPAPPAEARHPQAADHDDAEVAAPPQARHLDARRNGRRHLVPPGAVGRCRDARETRRSSSSTDAKIRRVVMCSGKVYYDLYEEREKRGLNDIYLLRVEQLYPWPHKALIQELGRFKNAEFVWCQEEPYNMGAWTFAQPNIERVLEYRGGRQPTGPLCGAARVGLDRDRTDEQASERAEDLPRRSARRRQEDDDDQGNPRAGARRIGHRGDDRQMVQAGGRGGEGR